MFFPLFTLFPVNYEFVHSHSYYPVLMESYFSASVDTGGYGIVWNDDIDIACDELFFNAEAMKREYGIPKS